MDTLSTLPGELSGGSVVCEVCNYVAIVIAICYVMKYNYYEWRHCMNKMHALEVCDFLDNEEYRDTYSISRLR